MLQTDSGSGPIHTWNGCNTTKWSSQQPSCPSLKPNAKIKKIGQLFKKSPRPVVGMCVQELDPNYNTRTSLVNTGSTETPVTKINRYDTVPTEADDHGFELSAIPAKLFSKEFVSYSNLNFPIQRHTQTEKVSLEAKPSPRKHSKSGLRDSRAQQPVRLKQINIDSMYFTQNQAKHESPKRLSIPRYQKLIQGHRHIKRMIKKQQQGRISNQFDGFQIFDVGFAQPTPRLPFSLVDKETQNSQEDSLEGSAIEHYDKLWSQILNQTVNDASATDLQDEPLTKDMLENRRAEPGVFFHTNKTANQPSKEVVQSNLLTPISSKTTQRYSHQQQISMRASFLHPSKIEIIEGKPESKQSSNKGAKAIYACTSPITQSSQLKNYSNKQLVSSKGLQEVKSNGLSQYL